MNGIVRIIIGLIVNTINIIRFRRFKFCFTNSITPFYISIGSGKIQCGSNLVTRRNINFNVSSGTLMIGNRVFINNDVSINCKHYIEIGDDVLFGESVKVYDHDHVFDGISPVKKKDFTSEKIKIESGCWIGANSVIVKGVTIGRNSVVAAGSVVYKNIPEGSLYLNGEIRVAKK
ncbi:acyltransferase [Vibrio breoganii]